MIEFNYYLIRRTWLIVGFLIFDNLELRNIKTHPIIPLIPLVTAYLLSWRLSGFIGPLYWGIAQLIGYGVLSQKYNIWYSLNTSLMGAASFGWLYELPWYHPPSMIFSGNPPFFYHSSFICLILFIYLLKRENYTFGKLSRMAAVFFVFWELVYWVIIENQLLMSFCHVSGLRVVRYTAKLGGMATLTAILIDHKKNKGYRCNLE